MALMFPSREEILEMGKTGLVLMMISNILSLSLRWLLLVQFILLRQVVRLEIESGVFSR